MIERPHSNGENRQKTPGSRRKAILVFSFIFIVIGVVSFLVIALMDHIVLEDILEEAFVVEETITGDFLKLSNGETVKLLGIDVPETRKNDRANWQCNNRGIDLRTLNAQGTVAWIYVRSLVEGKEVLLEYDVEKEDQWGLKLAYVYVPVPESVKVSDYPEGIIVRKGNGKNYYFLNALLVYLDYAIPFPMPPNNKYFVFIRSVDKSKN